MLHQKRSGSLAKLKYLIAVPLCMGLLYQSTFGFDKSYGLINIAPKPAVILPRSTDTIPAKEPVNVEKELKGKVKGLNIQNSKKTKSTGAAIISDGKTSEQVFVRDKNGKLIDFNSDAGKAIHAENLLQEQAKGKVKGYVIRTKDPKIGASTTIDENGKPITDALNREGDAKVKGLNIQNTPSANVEKLLQNKVKGLNLQNTVANNNDADIRIDEPATKQDNDIRIDEPVQQSPKKQPRPIPQKAKSPKPVKFPPPVVTKDKSALKKQVKFPPPIVTKNKKVAPVKFPPPVVKPAK